MPAFSDGIVPAGSETAAGDAARSDGPADPAAHWENELSKDGGAATVSVPAPATDDPVAATTGPIAANARRAK